MKIQSMLCALCLTSFAASHGAAAEYEHCFDGSPPTDALPTTDPQRERLFGIGYGVMPVLLRRACGLDDERDARHLQALAASVGCSPTSDLGREFAKALTVGLESVGGLEGMQARFAAEPEKAKEQCAAVARIPMPALDDAGAFLSPTVEFRLSRGHDRGSGDCGAPLAWAIAGRQGQTTRRRSCTSFNLDEKQNVTGT